MSNRSSFYSIVAALLLAIPLVAQQPSLQSDPMGNNNTITVAVMAATGGPVPAGTRLVLRSEMGREWRGYTDDHGKCLFDDLRNGDYVLTVEGGDTFRDNTQTIRISRPTGALPERIQALVRLEPKDRNAPPPAVVKADATVTPKKARDHYQKGLTFINSNQGSEAVKELEAAVAIDPKFAAAQSELGIQYAKLGQMDKAAAALAKAVELRPDSYDALVNYGIVLLRLSRPTEAEPQLLAALRVRADSGIAHYFLGRVMMTTKRPDEAEIYFKRAVEMGGGDVRESYRMLGSIYLDRGDHPKALAALESYVSLNPQAPDVEQLKAAVSQLRAAVAAQKPD